MEMKFQSRKSNVLTTGGCVSCNQPLAAKVGIDILEKGGNAADSAVAVAAALAVVEPDFTGLGGDAFCLFYDSQTKQVKGLNGSGCAPAAMTLELVKSRGFSSQKPIPSTHGLSITVPGAPAAWLDTLTHFGSGKVTVDQVLSPAVSLAEGGYPVTEVISAAWIRSESLLRASRFGKELLIDGKAPRVGEVIKLPSIAHTLKELIAHGKPGYYQNRVAQAIVDEVAVAGGVMSLQDLADHESTLVEPISVSYKGVRLWEIPPNSLGITALIALNILEGYDLKGLGNNSVQYLHTLAEAIKLSFADALTFVADPAKVPVPVEAMLSKAYAAERRKLISPDKAQGVYLPGDLPPGSDTTYFSVVDKWGNACSFINSNYQGFGTGVVPNGCGFSLQNRGLCFSLKEHSANVVAPRKRPMHTIIPAMVTSAADDTLLACYGIMGGFMQPQAHVQVLLNMVEFGMSPQAALDQSRLLVNIQGVDPSPSIGELSLEDGIPQTTLDALRALGHQVGKNPIVGDKRAVFGRGHVITKGAWWMASDATRVVANDARVLWAGSDPRCDGLSIGTLN